MFPLKMVALSIVLLVITRGKKHMQYPISFKIRAWRECRVKFLEVPPSVSDLLVINGDLMMVNDY